MKNFFYLQIYRACIKFSFIFTKIEYIARKIVGRISNEKEIIDFLKEKGITIDSSALEMYFKFQPFFTWRADKSYSDYAKHPFVFFFDRRDDCDGYALFYEYILKDILGFSEVYRAFVMADNGNGHAVCVCKFKDGYYIVGNWAPIKCNNDMEEIGNIVSKGMKGELRYISRFSKNKIIDDLIK